MSEKEKAVKFWRAQQERWQEYLKEQKKDG